MYRFKVEKFGNNDYGILDTKWNVRTAFFMKGSSIKQLEIYCSKLNNKRGCL